MKVKISALLFMGLPCLMFAQNDTESKKISGIKMDPVSYVDKGGLLYDEIILLPEKKPAIITPDFTIHVNLNNSEDQDKVQLFVPVVDYLEVGLMRDQATEDYKIAKMLWIDQNRDLYELNTRPDEVSNQGQLRNQK